MSSAVVARRVSALVRLEHTVFALPYAYIGAVLASHGMPRLRDLVAITVAMAAARSLAMALNRLIDAELDAANPRTARRELPQGLLSRRQVIGFCLLSVVVFAAAVTALSPITRVLAPIPIIAFVAYPYLKRFTSLCHLALGAIDGLAPVGAYVAITGRVTWQPFLLGAVVMFWMSGFDIIYATLDYAHDAAHGIHSLPAAVGIGPALVVTRILHVAAVAAMISVGVAFGLGGVYYVGVAACSVLLAYENLIVSPTDLSRVNQAFFTINAVIAAAYLAAVVLDVAAA